jgi:diaminohydroxyphosphoribosylaminopyrimidine deaminase/5-amino-6-(5-phosphoribosylamino)uracil reductase
VVAPADAPVERRDALSSAGVTVLTAGDLAGALRAIAAAGVESMLCEGGGVLASALLNERLVDRLSLFYAPFFLGASAPSAFADVADTALAHAARWRRLRTEAFGEDTLIELAR